MRALSIELRYLIYVATIMAFIWVPYILAHIAQVGLVTARLGRRWTRGGLCPSRWREE